MVEQIQVLDNLTNDLRKAVADLHQVNAFAGLFRFSGLGLIFLTFVACAWLTHNIWVFLFASTLAAIFYGFWLICTHDAVHRTLIGSEFWEEILSRFVSWPMLWPFGVYSELHALHHGWNGHNLRDPERVQWTVLEYENANLIQRWYMRYQWELDIFVFGGLGLIIKTFIKGVQLQSFRSRLWWQVLLDLSGIFLIQGSLVAIAFFHGVLFKYLLFWFIQERIIGIIVQTRDHLEHYGLWSQAKGHQLTQLYACRNLNVNRLTGWLMGGLNYHAVHHAFPSIPFNHLPEAFDRIQQILQQHNLPLMELEQGYVQAALNLSKQPSLIGEINPTNSRGRYQSISLRN